MQPQIRVQGLKRLYSSLGAVMNKQLNKQLKQLTVTATKQLNDGSCLVSSPDKETLPPVFGLLPGEVAVVEFTQHSTKLVSLIKHSKWRKPAPCPHYMQCGGCNLQHLGYKQQLAFKQQVVKDTLARYSHIVEEQVLRPPIASTQQWNYRTKLTPISKLENGQVTLGFMARDSHSLVNVVKCNLATPEIQLKYDEIRSFTHQKGKLHPHTLRESLVPPIGSKKSDVLPNKAAEYPPSPMVVEGQPKPWSKFVVTDPREQCLMVINGYLMRFVASSFFQVNPWIASKLCLQISSDFKKYRKATTLIDAYSGSGLLGISCAEHFDQVVGIESDITASHWAVLNARANNLTNYRAIHGKVEDVLPTLSDSKTALLINPPKTGCTSQFLDQVVSLKPMIISYVSCNVVTQFRDLEVLMQRVPEYWTIVKVQVYDMFPQTSRMETLVTMQRLHE
jgi:tRNA/tmRNA/rRNA uracil-C5-methylase (TrmA/RlmC/RlmD family)